MEQSRRIKKPVQRGKSRRMKGGLKPRIRNKKKLTRRNFKIKKGGGSFITIYILCFNEEMVINFTINAYRKLFPNCKIVIYDNESTNTSAEKAKALQCEVKSFSTGWIDAELTESSVSAS